MISGLAIPGLSTKVESIIVDNSLYPLLDEDKVREAVLLGIADEGDSQPGRIIYYTGDTSDYNSCRLCAKILIRHIMRIGHGRCQEDSEEADHRFVGIG